MKRLLFAITLIISSLTLSAQITNAHLMGTVTNQDHETLLGATVTAIHDPSGTRMDAVTDQKGIYRLVNMTPGGPYT